MFRKVDDNRKEVSNLVHKKREGGANLIAKEVFMWTEDKGRRREEKEWGPQVAFCVDTEGGGDLRPLPRRELERGGEEERGEKGRKKNVSNPPRLRRGLQELSCASQEEKI